MRSRSKHAIINKELYRKPVGMRPRSKNATFNKEFDRKSIGTRPRSKHAIFIKEFDRKPNYNYQSVVFKMLFFNNQYVD